MTKKRVYELAKEYGLKAEDLVKKLQDLGIEKVRNKMSALDEFEIIQVQAKLEIAGVIKESATSADLPAEDKTHGVVKKRRRTMPAAAPVEEAPAPAPAPIPVVPPVEAVAEPAPAEPIFEVHESPAQHHILSEPVIAEESAPAAAQSVEEAPIEEAPAAAEPAAEAPAEAALELSAEAEVAPLAEVAAASEQESVFVAEAATPQIEEAVAAAPAPPAPAAPPPRIEPPRITEPRVGEPRPTRAIPGRPGAKIVGHIDPALLRPARPTAPARPQQRTAGSTENITTSGATPDVRPTMQHNRKRALQRTDAGSSRDRLSTAQLREKEQSRVRRLTGPQKGGLGQLMGKSGVGGGRGQGPSIERRAQIVVEPPVTVRSLSEALGVKSQDIVRVMFMQFKRMVQPNSTLSDEDAKLLALELGFEIDVHTAVSAEEEMHAKRESEEEDPTLLEPRAPVIAFLGHVDHGKTSLIDAIRSTNVAAGEAGGITQHIGAYRVGTRSGHPITILDTPGHEAFTEMRKRGAQATDIVVLVVAADDGVMPQTEEAYNHARAAGVPVIVALNKSDRASDAQKDKTISQLASIGLAPESWKGTNWGGHTAIIETSATKRTGIDELLERVALEAEVLDLKANPHRAAEGIVLEAEKSGQRGIVATLLVQRGTLNRGDVILAGAGYGKVRNLSDDRGRQIKDAGPSLPVEVTGLSELPAAGDRFVIVEDLAEAAEVASERARKMREIERAGSARDHVTLTNLFSRIKAGQARDIKLVLKADVTGSLEVLKKELGQLTVKDSTGTDVNVKVIHAQVGAISEADVNLAASSDAIVVGFHVIAADAVMKLAQREGVEVRLYQVYTHIVEELTKAMEGLLSPVQREVVTGHAEIRAVFRSSKFGNIAGCFVTDGVINRTHTARLVRNGAVIYTGKLDSLRRVKDDVREVRAGLECGLKVAGYEDIKDGDVIEMFETREEKGTVA
ncbi:MAG: translation initiation factor IF-2 [Planctomycetes bacterium]|nr:translation initiation factor IF-2 [Planctomycetota bacterium]